MWGIIMIELKIQAVGSGVGVELPPEVLKQLQTSEGETIFLENMFDGSYSLTKHDEKSAEQMMLIDGQMHEEDS
jgi:antitoxin component of MazEF toxin-antitoxin module